MDRYYHRKQAEAEEVLHEGRFEAGKEIEIGKQYSGIRTRDGRTEPGPFAALADEGGLLLVGDVEENKFCVIDTDVVDDEGWIYCDRISGVFSLHEPLEELVKAGDVERIQRASQQKFFWRLSEAGARLFLKAAPLFSSV